MSEAKPADALDVGYHITVQKQSMMTGEVIIVTTNLPKSAVSEDIRKAIDEITRAIDWRIPQPTDAEANLVANA